MRALPRLFVRLIDAAAGAWSSVWPRTVAAREVRRLAQEGHAVGAFHEIQFAVSFDEGDSDAALAAMHVSGFTTRERTRDGGCCIVVARIPLTAWDLHVTTARLQRLVAPHSGFAALIGPLQRPAVLRAPGILSHVEAVQ